MTFSIYINNVMSTYPCCPVDLTPLEVSERYIFPQHVTCTEYLYCCDFLAVKQRNMQFMIGFRISDVSTTVSLLETA